MASKNATACTGGHDLTSPSSYYFNDGQKRCRECRRQKYKERAKLAWARKRARDDTKLGIERTGIHHQMLALIQERERCATWWEREAVDLRYAELQRMLGTVEA